MYIPKMKLSFSTFNMLSSTPWGLYKRMGLYFSFCSSCINIDVDIASSSCLLCVLVIKDFLIVWTCLFESKCCCFISLFVSLFWRCPIFWSKSDHSESQDCFEECLYCGLQFHMQPIFWTWSAQVSHQSFD